MQIEGAFGNSEDSNQSEPMWYRYSFCFVSENSIGSIPNDSKSFGQTAWMHRLAELLLSTYAL